MSKNPYKFFDNISHSEENDKLVENIILSLSKLNSDDNIDNMSIEFKKIKCSTFRDVEAMQYAVYYIAKKAKCSKFREKNEFAIVY